MSEQSVSIRSLLSTALATVIAVVSSWLTYVMGGAGALLCVIPAVVITIAWAVRRRRRRDPEGTWSDQRVRRHELWALALGALTAAALWNGVSFARYVGHDDGDAVSQRAATWARNHGLGAVIDYLEARVYSTPPSKDPSQVLAVIGGGTSTTTPDTTPASSTPSSTPAGGSTTPTTSGPTTTAGPSIAPPPPLSSYFSPPLSGEGQWTQIASAGGQPAMWVTGIRPLKEAGGVIGTMVVLDQTHLRAGLFNGDEEPGGGPWARGNKVPADLQPALLAAFNGGFRLEHIKGGYVTEGKVVKRLKDGDATLAVGKDGILHIGALGRDIKNDGSWLSLRQNLRLIVDGGVSKVAEGIRLGVWWGADYGNKVYVNRSGVCEIADGRLAYVLIGKVDAEQFAQSMINIGCKRAMQLDINGTWPNFAFYTHPANGTITPHLVDDRMGTNFTRYLKGSRKEFIAFFDAGTLPATSVLDR